MKRISILFTAILAFVGFVSFSMVDAASDNFAVGATVENFKLPDTNGKEMAFNDLKGKNGAVIVFLSVQCPVVRGYDERIVKIAEEYKAKGINVIGINSNSTESPADVKSHAADHYKFPVLIDKGNVLADKFNAYATPEMFLFDASNKLIYHGAIDNDRSGENVTSNFLRDAMEEHLAGKAISKNDTKAIGCTIKRAGQ